MVDRMVLQLEGLDEKNQKLFYSLLEKLQETLMILPDKPEETPENTLFTLWHFVNGDPMSYISASQLPLLCLDKEKHRLLVSLVQKRIQGTPLAYISGRQNFMGLELMCNESALIPRKETELLAAICLEQIGEAFGSCSQVNVLDLFTGSGNLPLCFKKNYPSANIYGSDLSEKAIALARQNSQFLGLPVDFVVSDMFSAFPAEDFTSFFDVISGAPPYISSVKVNKMAAEISRHEPNLAFDAGPFGIKFFTQMIKESPRLLKPYGRLIFEVGLGQGEGIARRFRKDENYDNIQLIKDKNGDVRVLAARCVA